MTPITILEPHHAPPPHPARRRARRPAAVPPAAVLLAAAVLHACSGGDAASERDSAAAAATRAIIAPPSTPYRETALAAVGRVRGRVLGADPGLAPDVPGAPAPRAAAAPAREGEPTCEDRSPATATPGIDGGLAGAVVWLRDARQGKALPLERRYALTNRGCRLEPHVQAAIAGGTLNVRSLDPVEHRTRLVRQGEPDPVAVVREFDEGQVVPDEQVLERPALVHATCEVHPWSSAWIAVFDHPYFAVTTPDGAFVIDSIPPGKYRLVVWHERAGTRERAVEVRAGETVVEVEVK